MGRRQLHVDGPNVVLRQVGVGNVLLYFGSGKRNCCVQDETMPPSREYNAARFKLCRLGWPEAEVRVLVIPVSVARGVFVALRASGMVSLGDADLRK